MESSCKQYYLGPLCRPEAEVFNASTDVRQVPEADMNLASDDSKPYSTGVRMGAPLFLTKTTRNFAGSVLLALRPTT